MGPLGRCLAGSGSVLGSITVISASPVTLSTGPSQATLQLATLPAQDKTPVFSGARLLSVGTARQHSSVAAGPHLGTPALSHHSPGQAAVPRDSLAGHRSAWGRHIWDIWGSGAVQAVGLEESGSEQAQSRSGLRQLRWEGVAEQPRVPCEARTNQTQTFFSILADALLGGGPDSRVTFDSLSSSLSLCLYPGFHRVMVKSK